MTGCQWRNQIWRWNHTHNTWNCHTGII